MKANTILKAGAGFILMLASTQVALAESLNQTKVGARAGMVDVDGLGSTLGMGAFAEVPLTQALSVRPSADYWQKSETESSGLVDVDVTVSDLTLGGAAKYSFALPETAVKPYVVGGLALHRLSAEVKASGYGSEFSHKSSDTEFGFDLGGGVAYSVSKSMDVSGEILLRNVDEADVTTITGGISYAM